MTTVVRTFTSARTMHAVGAALLLGLGSALVVALLQPAAHRDALALGVLGLTVVLMGAMLTAGLYLPALAVLKQRRRPLSRIAAALVVGALLNAPLYLALVLLARIRLLIVADDVLPLVTGLAVVGLTLGAMSGSARDVPRPSSPE